MTVTSEYEIDPVCGMTVTSPSAPSVSWRGGEYRFCEEACRDTSLPSVRIRPLRRSHYSSIVSVATMPAS